MLRLRYALVLASLIAVSCGTDDSPVVYEQVLVDNAFTLEAGTFYSLPFSVDLTEVTEVRVFAYVEADATIEVLLLSTVEFDKMVENLEFTALYRSGEQTLVDIEVPVTESGTYRAVISNMQGVDADRQVGAAISVLFERL